MRASNCIYCGISADTVEHFPPASITSEGYLFSACRECNSFASTIEPYFFDKRFKYVKSKISKRYSHLRKAFAYSCDELKEFEGVLRLDCELWTKAKEYTNKRLAWSVQDYFDLIDQSNPFVVINVDNRGIIEKEKELLIPIDVKNINNKSLYVPKISDIRCKECNGEIVDRKITALYCSKYCSIKRFKKRKR
jgi:hypothetical protein